MELLEDERSYSENEWRDLMLQFILLIFPKYVGVLRNVLVKDPYTNPKKLKNRYIDVALVDANGHIDTIEIKKPLADCLMSAGEYRGNFTPRKAIETVAETSRSRPQRYDILLQVQYPFDLPCQGLERPPLLVPIFVHIIDATDAGEHMPERPLRVVG